MKVRLYGLPGIAPDDGGAGDARVQGHRLRRIDLVPFLARAIVRRAIGMPQNTVPVLTIDGRRVQGSREIARELERLRPEPPLFPGDAGQRLAVEEAERWGEEELQHPIRQISLWAMRANRAPIRSYMGSSVMGVPAAVAARLAPPFIAAVCGSMRRPARPCAPTSPRSTRTLGGVEERIATGVLDGDDLNAADFQIGASVRLLLTFQDLRPLIEDRPAGRLARRAVPRYRGDAPPVFPPAWLEPLRSATAAK